MARMELEHFEELVRRGLEDIPEEIAERISNVDVIVEESPTQQQLAALRVPRGHTLLGLYTGVPLTRRSSGYNMAMPDRITIFKRPLEHISRDDDDLVSRVRDTVIHEVAHHFGISDARLDEIEAERREGRR